MRLNIHVPEDDIHGIGESEKYVLTLSLTQPSPQGEGFSRLPSIWRIKRLDWSNWWTNDWKVCLWEGERCHLLSKPQALPQ